MKDSGWKSFMSIWIDFVKMDKKKFIDSLLVPCSAWTISLLKLRLTKGTVHQELSFVNKLTRRFSPLNFHIVSNFVIQRNSKVLKSLFWTDISSDSNDEHVCRCKMHCNNDLWVWWSVWRGPKTEKNIKRWNGIFKGLF